MNYTKGEWYVDPNYDWVRAKEIDGRVVANCTGYDREQQRANANLIAASPEMHEALKLIKRDFGDGKNVFWHTLVNPPNQTTFGKIIDGVLAKAEGVEK